MASHLSYLLNWTVLTLLSFLLQPNCVAKVICVDNLKKVFKPQGLILLMLVFKGEMSNNFRDIVFKVGVSQDLKELQFGPHNRIYNVNSLSFQ